MTRNPENTESSRFRDCSRNVAAVCESEDRKLESEFFSKSTRFVVFFNEIVDSIIIGIKIERTGTKG